MGKFKSNTYSASVYFLCPVSLISCLFVIFIILYVINIILLLELIILVMLATLDVRNDFNSARRNVILDALQNKFNTPTNLLRMVGSYLSDKQLIYDTTDRPYTKKIIVRAAQGFDLWNVSYDGIL